MTPRAVLPFQFCQSPNYECEPHFHGLNLRASFAYTDYCPCGNCQHCKLATGPYWSVGLDPFCDSWFWSAWNSLVMRFATFKRHFRNVGSELGGDKDTGLPIAQQVERSWRGVKDDGGVSLAENSISSTFRDWCMPVPQIPQNAPEQSKFYMLTSWIHSLSSFILLNFLFNSVLFMLLEPSVRLLVCTLIHESHWQITTCFEAVASGVNKHTNCTTYIHCDWYSLPEGCGEVLEDAVDKWGLCCKFWEDENDYKNTTRGYTIWKTVAAQPGNNELLTLLVIFL